MWISGETRKLPLTEALHAVWPNWSYFGKKEWAKNIVCRDIPEKTCSCKGGLIKYWFRGLNTNTCHVFQICKKCLTPCIILLPLHNFAPLYVGLLDKIWIKYILVCEKMWKSSKSMNTFSRHCNFQAWLLFGQLISMRVR